MSTDVIRIDRDGIVDFIADILCRRGGESYLGEDVTMLQHMLQAAALAEEAGEDDEVVAGALLHDIGHYTSEFPEASIFERNNRHDECGASVLSPYFPPRTVACVRHHVDAKRYLCAVDPGYLSMLSKASVKTLELQGGPMDGDEVNVFASMPYLGEVLRVRRYDDRAKDAERTTPEFDHFRSLLRRLAAMPRTPQQSSMDPQGGTVQI